MQRVPRAVRQQVLDDGGADLDVGEAGRPADDVELMVVLLTRDRPGAVLHEQRDDFEVAALGGEVQWERVVAFIANVRIRAALEQRPDDFDVLDAEMQRRAQSRVPLECAALVDDVGISIENRGERCDVASIGGPEQRLQRLVAR